MFSCHWIFFVWSDPPKKSFKTTLDSKRLNPHTTHPQCGPSFLSKRVCFLLFFGVGKGEGVQYDPRNHFDPRCIRRVDTRQFVHRHGEFFLTQGAVCSLGTPCFQPLKNGRSYQSFGLGVTMWHKKNGKKMRHVYLSRKQAMTVMQCLTPRFLEN